MRFSFFKSSSSKYYSKLSLGTFNIPKYFEFQWKDNEDDYDTTALNENRTYIVFCSWWNDLTVFGIIPFVALVVFNLKIYFKVRSSDKLEYRFVGRKANSTRSTLETHVRDISLRRYICFVTSVRLWNFKDGGSYKARFLAKNQYTTALSFWAGSKYLDQYKTFWDL